MTQKELRKELYDLLLFYTGQHITTSAVIDRILTLIREAGYVKTKYSPEAIERVMNRLRGIQEKDLEDYGPETGGDK